MGQPASIEPLRPDPRPVVASQAMLRVFATLERVASSVVPVLILGETGTGKEVVARAIHDGGARAERPFKCVNCGGLPEALVEATLFGHEKGAFTGAADRKLGVFEAAEGGTVFLDEIGELPAAAQAALLRVLETKRITRVGGVDEVPVDVRILAATHRDLESMCARGAFRWDLYYRLNVFSLRLPPLRERREDIQPLAERFLRLAADANGRRVQRIGSEALERLRSHPWPGNVRELKNVVDRAVVMASGEEIQVTDLPEALRHPARPPYALPESEDLGLDEAPAAEAQTDDVEERPTEPPELADVTEDLEQPGPILDYKTQMMMAERRVLLGALVVADLNQTEAARLLRMPLRTLVHKIKALGLREELTRLKAERSRRSGSSEH